MKQKPERMQILAKNIPPHLIERKAWIIWNWEWRDGRWTKPPRSLSGKPARSNDSSTWHSFGAVWKSYASGKCDGIGYMISKDDALCGVDWDDCRDKASGDCDPEIWDWIKEIDSYTEVSPSGNGYTTLLKGKLPKGGHHGERVGVFDNTRYFCITGHVLAATSPNIMDRQEELNNLINTYWPKDLKPQEDAPERPSPAKTQAHSLTNDEIIQKASVSKQGQKFKQLWDGDTSGYPSPSEADLALCTMLAFWCGPNPARVDALFRQSKLNRDKWDRDDYRNRTIEKAISQTTEYYKPGSHQNDTVEAQNDPVMALNERHALVKLGGKTVVMNEVTDPVFNRPDVTFSTIADFKNWYANRKLIIEGKSVSLPKRWLESPHRRQYDGIIFNPSKHINGYYNLWRGFAVEPAPGDWSLLQEHIFENICQENIERFDYLKAWMADIVQTPGGERSGTSIVMRGPPGVGKGVFGRLFGSLFGSHFLHITNQNQLTGRFNNHLKDALLVFCDEAIWAGDKSAEGVLKGMITEDLIMVEPKGKDAFPVQNRIRLIIASNSDWVVPVGLQDRRFVVLDVGDSRRRDYKFFGSLIDQMNQGGRAAMLYNLLQHDTSGVELRSNPATEALLEQKLRSMTTVQKFWHDCLCDGTIGDDGWTRNMVTKDLYDHYVDFAKKIGERYLLADSVFSKELKRIMPQGFRRIRPSISGVQKWCYTIPDLEVCRSRFEEIVGSVCPWEEVD